jgi:sugar O-acyltransferase (sialic acid O-acetyltransferase NeuD family)
MKPIAIFGAGGQGQTVADCFASIGYNHCLFLDDKLMPDGPNRLKERSFLECYNVIVALGDNHLRKTFCELVLWHSGQLAKVYHQNAAVSASADIRGGTSVHFGAHVGPNASIGRGCIVNTLATVGHDCRIGDYVNICDGAVLGGGVSIADQAFIGLNATILPRTRIGRGAFIAAGAVVVHHVGDGERVAGNPAVQIGGWIHSDRDLTAGPLSTSSDASSSDRPAAASDSDPAAAATATDTQLGTGHE